MSFEYNKELNGWFLSTDDGFIACYDFYGQKIGFRGDLVDWQGRKYTTDNNTECVNPENNTIYTEEKLVD